MDKGTKIQVTAQEEQLHHLEASITATYSSKKITKIGYWLDAAGDVKYVKYYSGDELIFTLTYSNAGSATNETWNVTRT